MEWFVSLNHISVPSDGKLCLVLFLPLFYYCLYYNNNTQLLPWFSLIESMNGCYSALEPLIVDSKNWCTMLHHHLLYLSTLKPINTFIGC